MLAAYEQSPRDEAAIRLASRWAWVLPALIVRPEQAPDPVRPAGLRQPAVHWRRLQLAERGHRIELLR
eukprot:5169444-Lingulodinium_polyedra.AAC.1